MASPETEEMIKAMVKHSRNGYYIFPMMFQPRNGLSNTVAAAIRVALNRKLIIQDGVDGAGNARYTIITPRANYYMPEKMQ